MPVATVSTTADFALIREALEMDHSLGQCGLLGDCETCAALVALARVEADAKRLNILDALDLPLEIQPLQSAYWSARRSWLDLESAYLAVAENLLVSGEQS